MTKLQEIKIEAIKKNIKMSDLAKELNVSREYMYRCIRNEHSSFLEKIEKILNR